MEKKKTEMTRLRSASSKTYVNQDHSYTKEIYLDEIHYRDLDGDWKEMDDSLSEQHFENEKGTVKNVFVNKKGSFEACFRVYPEEGNSVTLTEGMHFLSWGLLNCLPVKAVKTKTSTLTYQEILPSVSAVCSIKGKRIKEDLEIGTPEAAYEIIYLYRTDSLLPKESAGRIDFCDKEGTPVFCIGAPVVYDKKGNSTEKIQTRLEKAGDGMYRITFCPDEEWLRAPERVFPVTLDPVTVTSRSAADIEDSYVDSLYYGDTHMLTETLKTGGGIRIRRSFLRFALPELSPAEMIVNARLVLVSLTEDGRERTVQLHRVLQNWSSSTLTWQNKPLYDAAVEDACTFTGDEVKYISMDITGLVKDWYHQSPNYGLMLRDAAEISGDTAADFLSSDTHSDYSSYRPRIEITYMNFSGLEDFWSFHTQEAGRAGTVHVNDYNGNLVMELAITASGGERMPVQASLVYNSSGHAVNRGYGYGFCLNYHQTLEAVRIGERDYYRYTDGDGTVHYFYYKEDESAWKDESGLSLTLEPAASGNVIRNKKDDRLVFDTSGRLARMEDRNGNTILISYSGGVVDRITDGAGRETTFTYYRNASGTATGLCTAADPAGRIRSFRYGGDGILASVSWPDGMSSAYVWDQNHLPVRITDQSCRGLEYTYSEAPYRVTMIREHASGNTGRFLELQYGRSCTGFTDREGRVLLYHFNTAGNLLYVQDGFGNAASSKYSPEETKKNQLDSVSALQGSIVQLLKDPLGVDDVCGWTAYAPVSGMMDVAKCTAEGFYLTGGSSLMVSSRTLSQYACWNQSVKIRKGGTYTLSMYVKAVIRTLSDSSMCCLRVRYMDHTGTAQYVNSQMLRHSTDGFVRLCCTFTVPEDASSDTLKLYLLVYHASADLYFDLGQLEPGETASRCNLIRNGDFHTGTAEGFSFAGTDSSDHLTDTDMVNRIPDRMNLMVSAASAGLRNAPSPDAPVLSSYTKGSRLQGLSLLDGEDGGAWYLAVSAGGTRGYLPAGQMQAYDCGDSSVQNGIVAVTGAILRSGPSTSSTPVEEWIPQGTMVAIRETVPDASGWKWYRCGFTVGSMYLQGYFRQDLVALLAVNDPYGTVRTTTRCYLSPSSGASRGAYLSAGSVKHMRGLVYKPGNERWHAYEEGGRFYYLPDSAVDMEEACVTEPVSGAAAGRKLAGQMEQVYAFRGDYGTEKSLTKEIAMSGQAGDVFLVNGWAKAAALPETAGSRKFCLRVVLEAADGETETMEFPFDPKIRDWQYTDGICIARRDFAGIRVSFVYSGNANTAFLSGLSLFAENFGQTYVYDEDGNVVSAENAAKEKTEFAYDSDHDMTGILTPEGRSCTYAYDSRHNVLSGTSAGGIVWRYSYDEHGNITGGGLSHVSDPDAELSFSRTMTGDGNHAASVTDIRGNSMSFTWDADRDLLSSREDANGNTTSYTFDIMDRVTGVTEAGSGEGSPSMGSSFTYEQDRIRTIRHNGADYIFDYNAYGERTGISVGSTALSSWEYEDAHGKLIRRTYGNWGSERYEYDARDRVTGIFCREAGQTGEVQATAYAYDRHGSLCMAASPQAGKTYHLDHDLTGRLRSVLDEAGNFSEYTYNADDQLTGISHSAGRNVRTEYSYDCDGREHTASAGGMTLTTDYDQYGRVNARHWSAVSGGNVSYSYERSSGMFPSAEYMDGSVTWFRYDADGNITRMVHQSRPDSEIQVSEKRYVYDAWNRLVREDIQERGLTLTYTYDAGGNLTEVREYPYTTAAVITSPPSAVRTGTYPASGWKDRLLSWNGTAITYDSGGNMATKGNVSYTWGYGRRLTGVDNGDTIRYAYDHNGMRVRKTVNGSVTEYRMAGKLLLSQKNPDGSEYYFHYDSAGNPVALSTGDAMYLYRQNLQGDIIGLSDSNGTTVVTYTYDSWGKLLSISGSLQDSIGAGNPLRYRGYYYDNETGLYYVKDRYYDPELMRWISPDELVWLGDDGTALSYNLYLYCKDNPVAYSDPTGHFITMASLAVCALGGIVGGTLGAFGAAATEGDVWHGVIEGCITGVIGAALGVLCPCTIMQFSFGFTAGVIVEGIKQMIESPYDPDYDRVFWTGVETGISAMMPSYGVIPWKMNWIDAASTIVDGAVLSTVMMCADIVTTNVVTSMSTNENPGSNNVVLYRRNAKMELHNKTNRQKVLAKSVPIRMLV